MKYLLIRKKTSIVIKLKNTQSILFFNLKVKIDDFIVSSERIDKSLNNLNQSALRK